MNDSGKKTILITDDHTLVRAGLRQLLEADGRFDIIEAENGIQALRKIKANNNIDTVLLDISMPKKNGIETLKDLAISHPRLPVLMLSSFGEEKYASRCLKLGAWGYLTKDSAPDVLISALEKVLSGGKYLSESMASSILDQMSKPNTDKEIHEILSDREFEVLRMLGNGLTITEIGIELNLSVKTVSTYRTRILEKTSLKNNADIIRYVLENRLID